MTGKPILFLDVDGPLNPYATNPAQTADGYITKRVKPESWIAMHPGKPRSYVKPLRVWLNPAHGEKLLSLPYDLVWATTWEAEANTYIGSVIGLPELPYVRFNRRPAPWPGMPDRTETDTLPGPDGTFFKTAQLVQYASGRHFVWVDDDATAVDERWIAGNHPGFGRIYHVNPRTGLVDDDFSRLRSLVCEMMSP